MTLKKLIEKVRPIEKDAGERGFRRASAPPGRAPGIEDEVTERILGYKF
jgi:hypothetical protein